MLDNLEDNFDKQTKNVKVDNLEQLIHHGVSEHRRNMINDKKNQSTAYKPAALPIPKPRQGNEDAAAAPEQTVNMSSDQSPEKIAIEDRADPGSSSDGDLSFRREE
jgi:hypothetical protein